MTAFIIAKYLALILAIIVISKSIVSYTQRKESLAVTIFWVLTWGAIIVLSFFQGLADQLIRQSGVGIGTVLGIALVFVYFVLYRIYVKADRVEKQLQNLVTKIAIDEVDSKETKRDN